MAVNFTPVKTYTALAVVESAPAASAVNFTSLEGLDTMAPRGRIARLVEIRLEAASTGGTVAPTAVSFDVWRFNRLDATRDYLATWTVAASDITAGKVAPLIVEGYTHYIGVSLSAFTGGTAPTFTGIVQARAVE